LTKTIFKDADFRAIENEARVKSPSAVTTILAGWLEFDV
jgi:hypothetical protein